MEPADGRWSFWKYEARLRMFDAESRLQIFLAILGGFVVVILPLVFGRQIGLEDLNARVITAIATVLLFPLALAAEMFRKGDEAGQRLKREVDQLRAETSDKLNRPLVATTLVDTKRKLRNSLERAKRNYPTSGKAKDLSDQQCVFFKKAKASFVEILIASDNVTSVIPGYKVGTEEVDDASGFNEMCENVQLKIDQIESLQQLLHQSAGAIT